MSLERNVISLQELNATIAREVPIWPGVPKKTKITTNLDLPYVDEEQIGFNLAPLSRICRVAGIKTLHIVSNASGPISEYIPRPVGWFGDIGVAGASEIVKKAPTSFAELRAGKEPIQTRWAEETISINTNEIQDRIRRAEKPLGSPEMWSLAINDALQRDILRKGASHLMGDVVDKGFDLGTGVLSATLPLFSLIRTGEASAYGYDVLRQYTLWNLAQNVLTRLGPGGKDFRWSYFMGSQIDRAILLGIMTKKDWLLGTQSLVKPLAKK